MSYAVRNDGKGWRAVSSSDDVTKDETYSETEPVLKTPDPIVVKMHQARLALLQAGLLKKANKFFADSPGADGEAARIEWEFLPEIRRDQPSILTMAAALELSDEWLDEFFIKAANL
jgi:hypothetical protein